MSDSLWPYGLKHTRLPCPPSTGVCSNSCPSSRWCHPTISSSVVPFSSCLQSFPALGSFLMSQLFASDGQSTRASPSTSLLPMNIQDWFPLNLKSENEITQSCLTLVTPWTVAYQAPPSMGFSRQEYWSGLPFPSPGDLCDPGIEPGSPAL